MTTDPDALALLTSNMLGVLSTVAPDGQPRSRTLYYVANDAFEIFFMTLAGTRKVDDINHDPRAAFVVSDPESPRTLQIEGVVTAEPDTALIDPIVKRLMDNFMKQGPDFAPLTHLDPTTILFYRLTPTWTRLGKFAGASGTDEAFTDVTP
ncbi:MAG: pyridoxamine 5'-phosphate oxidase family protein [Patescibacteria group bacterium]